MKKHALTIACMVVALFFICATIAAQNVAARLQPGSPISPVRNIPGLKTKSYNFTSFTKSYKVPDRQWLLNNQEYTGHPDAGFVTTNDPPSNAIEIISKRTSDSKYYIDKDSATKFYIVKANEAINYQKSGQWLCIDKRLMPGVKNIFEANHQQEPVGFDLNKKSAYIKTVAGAFYFNNWELSGKNGSGEKSLAKADWTNVTEGDDGIKITNIFPGIDAEMIVNKGAVKTNFIIRQNKFTGYQQLIFSDEFNPQNVVQQTELISSDNTGSSEKGAIDFSVNKKVIAHINKAVIYSQKDPAKTYQYLTYAIDGNRLSIPVDVTNLNQQLLNGNVVIDPLVSSTATLPVASITGSMNNGNLNNACKYPLTITTPPKSTYTNISVEFGLTANAPALNKNAIFFVIANNCDTLRFSANPNQPSYDSSGHGITVDANGNPGFASVLPFLPCLPPPSCVPQTVGFTLGLYNTVTNGPDNICSNTYVGAYEPFQLMIEGHTIEMNTISAAPASICQGSSSTLKASAMYGVPASYIGNAPVYTTYKWSTGANGATISVSPAATTTYSVAIVDQCNDTAKGSVTVVVVDPVTPAVTISTPSTTVCQNAPVVFTADPTIGGNAPIYQWYLNGAQVGNGSNTYSTTSLATGDKISCVLTSNYYCVTTNIANSDTLMMTVMPDITPSINITASQNNFCFGKGVTFQARSLNVGPAPSYQWFVNGNPVGINDSSYTTTTLENNDDVSCIVSVSNTGCYTEPSLTSNNITMVIYPLPVITLSPQNVILARYDTVQIHATVISDIMNFSWTPTVGLVNPDNLSPVADPLTTTTYQLSVTSTNQCTDTSDITIKVYDRIFIPNAFAPDGKNNIFKIPQGIVFDLENFSVYDRWGNRVFVTSDINKGWDGTIEGQYATPGTYVYVISGSDLKGKVLVKGTVTLLH